VDTVLHINTASLDEALVKNVREQFGPAAELEIRVHTPPMFAPPMSEVQFWGIIGLLDWSQSDREAVIAPAIFALAALPKAAIHGFEDVLAEKLWLLDTEAHATASLGGNAEERLSEDLFLYDRCGVVARGRAFFEKVLHSPAAFPLQSAFSPLLRIARAAYEQKTGEKFVHFHRYSYETYSNESGWE